MRNAFVCRVLRSPFHAILSRELMLITVKGRSTGRTYTFPVGYTEVDDEVLVAVGHADRKRWWRNLVEPAGVTLRIRGKDVNGTAVARSDTESLSGYLARVPRAARRLRLPTNPTTGVTDPGTVAEAVASTAIVTVDSLRWAIAPESR